MIKLLFSEKASFRLLGLVRREFALLLEMGPPVVLDLIVCSSWQASSNGRPPGSRFGFFSNIQKNL